MLNKQQQQQRLEGSERVSCPVGTVVSSVLQASSQGYRGVLSHKALNLAGPECQQSLIYSLNSKHYPLHGGMDVNDSSLLREVELRELRWLAQDHTASELRLSSCEHSVFFSVTLQKPETGQVGFFLTDDPQGTFHSTVFISDTTFPGRNICFSAFSCLTPPWQDSEKIKCSTLKSSRK